MASVFLTNYFAHLIDCELSILVNSVDHLELLNSQLNFYLKFSSKQTRDDKLINFLEQLLIAILKKKREAHRNEFNQVEADFIVFLCRFFSFQKEDDLNEKINSIVLKDDLINLDLKVEIVQCLFEEKLVDDSSCSAYIDFVFRSLNSLVDEIRETTTNQQTTKLVNNLVWIIFDLVESDLHVDHLIRGVECFLSNVSNESTLDDNQLVELVLDFIASLSRFSEKAIELLERDESFRLKLEHIEQIRSIIKNDETTRLVVNSILNISNSSIRKKARYISDRFKLIPLIAVEILETLEEKQLHLIQPFIDKKLNCLLKSKLNIKPFQTVLELIIQRMFDHDCKPVKLYAFKFIQDQYALNELEFISEHFVTDQIISTLQDNLIYNEEFINESVNFLSRISSEKILKSLLDKATNLSSYGLYFVLKQKFLNLDDEKLSDKFDTFSIQKLLNLPSMIGDKAIRTSVQIHLIKIMIQNLDSNMDDIRFLLNVLYCVNIKEVKIENVFSKQQLVGLFDEKFIQLEQINLETNSLLVGLSRYHAIIYDKNHSNTNEQLYQLLDQLHSTDHFRLFLVDFLNIITSLDVNLLDKLIEMNDVFKDLEILELICSKVIDTKSLDKISEFLIAKIKCEDDGKLHFLGLLNDLNDSNCDQLIDDVLSSSTIKLDILNERHWRLLNKYLATKRTLDLEQIIGLISDQRIESKFDFLSNLISKIPTHINIYVIEFLGLLLIDELNSEIPVCETLILKNFFIFTDLLFKSCLEIKKVSYFLCVCVRKF